MMYNQCFLLKVSAFLKYRHMESGSLKHPGRIQGKPGSSSGLGRYPGRNHHCPCFGSGETGQGAEKAEPREAKGEAGEEAGAEDCAEWLGQPGAVFPGLSPCFEMVWAGEDRGFGEATSEVSGGGEEQAPADESV